LEVAVFEGGGALGSKISGRRGRPSTTICARLDRPASECLITLPLTVFTQRNFVADFIHEKPIHFLYGKRKKSLFIPHLGVRATYAVLLRFIEKLAVDFLLVIIELFSLGAFVLSQSMRLTEGVGQTDGHTDAYRKTSPA